MSGDLQGGTSQGLVRLRAAMAQRMTACGGGLGRSGSRTAPSGVRGRGQSPLCQAA